MRCRRCDYELHVKVIDEYEIDSVDCARVSIEFECLECNLEYDAKYVLEKLWCCGLGSNEGGGEIPIDLEEGRELFK